MGEEGEVPPAVPWTLSTGVQNWKTGEVKRRKIDVKRKKKEKGKTSGHNVVVKTANFFRRATRHNNLASKRG